jgi:two-component system phosphate regulon sensor histidine kinase PhoR
MISDGQHSDGPPGGAESSGTSLRNQFRQARVLRLLALAAGAGLLVIAHLSNVPWLATTLALLLIWLIFAGWKPSDPRQLRSSSPARGARGGPELRLNAVLDAISSPTILIDHRGIVVHTNAVALNAFPGLRQGHPVAFSLRAPAMLAALEAVLKGDHDAQTELSERIPVERSFDVVVRRLAGATEGPDSSAGFRPANGTAFAVIFMTETSAARRIEAMRVDFVANASHELRTPLASILGFIETLQGPARDDAPARRNFLAIMETQARRMARLINDLLSLSKIEMSAHIPPSEAVDLPMVLHSVCDALGGLARDRGVVFRFDMPEGPQQVIGDRDELLRVFENLIENAIKYGQSGGAVDIGLTRASDAALGDLIVVSVRDFGPGIAEKHLPRLTERFYRADVSESRVLGGTGLGLAIVKHIVTRHRGRLGIASQPGEGATFTVAIPAVKI